MAFNVFIYSFLRHQHFFYEAGGAEAPTGILLNFRRSKAQYNKLRNKKRKKEKSSKKIITDFGYSGQKFG
jgi:hypothetical protein